MNRNLKPENIIFKDLSDDFELVITDFGFAQYVSKPNVIFRRCLVFLKININLDVEVLDI
jgi:hypothetical protein